MIPLSLTELRQWIQALTDFDGALRTVKQNLDALTMIRRQAASWPPAMRAEHDALYRKGRAVYDRLLALQATRDKVRAWLAKLGSMAKSALGLGQLGVLPVIYVAAGLGAFVAAIAAARSFLADSQGFARRYQTLNETAARLIAAGVAPAEAYERAAGVAGKVAGEADEPGVIEKFGMRALLVVGLIAGAYFLLPRLLPAARRQLR